MCGVDKPDSQEQERDPILLTRADTAPTGAAANQRRRGKVRLDLNNAALYRGLTIPND